MNAFRLICTSRLLFRRVFEQRQRARHVPLQPKRASILAREQRVARTTSSPSLPDITTFLRRNFPRNVNATGFHRFVRGNENVPTRALHFSSTPFLPAPLTPSTQLFGISRSFVVCRRRSAVRCKFLALPDVVGGTLSIRRGRTSFVGHRGFSVRAKKTNVRSRE